MPTSLRRPSFLPCSISTEPLSIAEPYGTSGGVAGTTHRLAFRPGAKRASRDLEGVLSIGRVLAGDEWERYYREQVGQGREDYYAGEGDEGGVWLGTGAGSLGARGSVDEDGLTALLRGRDPVGGGELRRVVRQGGVSAFDLTFKPPKSVRLLWALGGEGVSAETRASHDSAVRQALRYYGSRLSPGGFRVLG